MEPLEPALHDTSVDSRSRPDADRAKVRSSGFRTSATFDGLVFVCLLVAFACTTLRPLEIDAVVEDASLAHARAQQLYRSSRLPDRGNDREEARREAERAIRLAPDWVAPYRLIDDLVTRGSLFAFHNCHRPFGHATDDPWKWADTNRQLVRDDKWSCKRKSFIIITGTSPRVAKCIIPTIATATMRTERKQIRRILGTPVWI